ncbi:unnamed protein product [Cochlearia groenlandica]
MQMMAERAAASQEATGSGSASGSGTAYVSTTPTPHLHAGTSSPIQTGTPPSVHAEPPPPPPPPVPAVPAVPAAVDRADRVVPGPQKWQCDVSINESVKTEFKKTAKFSLANTVYDWKDK